MKDFDGGYLINMYYFCKEYGWTITEFYDQPAYEIQALTIIMEEISKQKKREHDQQQAKMRHSSGGRRR